MTRLLLTLLLVILSLSDSGLSAQELNCRVEVNTSQLEGTNKSVFETLQSAINEYVNTTRWTNAQFSPNERIECTLFFNITKYDEAEGRMEGTLQVQAIRPVYNSSYTTTILNFRDTNINFTYTENEPHLLAKRRRSLFRPPCRHCAAGPVIGRDRLETV